jgi:hypothetical protein
LEQAGIKYALFPRETAVYVEIGRFGYRFNRQGKLSGGWIYNCGKDWEAQWEKWAALLRRAS